MRLMDTEMSQNAYFNWTIGGNRYARSNQISVYLSPQDDYEPTDDTDALYSEHLEWLIERCSPPHSSLDLSCIPKVLEKS